MARVYLVSLHRPAVASDQLYLLRPQLAVSPTSHLRVVYLNSVQAESRNFLGGAAYPCSVRPRCPRASPCGVCTRYSRSTERIKKRALPNGWMDSSNLRRDFGQELPDFS